MDQSGSRCVAIVFCISSIEQQLRILFLSGGAMAAGYAQRTHRFRVNKKRGKDLFLKLVLFYRHCVCFEFALRRYYTWSVSRAQYIAE